MEETIKKASLHIVRQAYRFKIREGSPEGTRKTDGGNDFRETDE